MQITDSQQWCDLCAQRIAELDPEIRVYEAIRLAREVYAFERTRAMPPQMAADFVATEMSRPDMPRFERRTRAR